MTDTPSPDDATGTPGMCEAVEHMQQAVTHAGAMLGHLTAYRNGGEPGSVVAAERLAERLVVELGHVLPWLREAATAIAPGRHRPRMVAVLPMGGRPSQSYDAPHDGTTPTNAPA